MRTKKYCGLIIVLAYLCFVGQKAGAQDDLTRSNPLKDITTPLPEDTIPAKPAGIDTIPADTIIAPTDTVPKKTNAIDAPISGVAKDSMIMDLSGGQNKLFLFGEGKVDYRQMNLTGEYIEVDAKSSIVYATFALDSLGEEFGYPVFKDGDTEYEMKVARYNFNTKKMKIIDVITQQGEGYVTASETKKMPNDDLYMRDGKYTTCDDQESPHFYLHLTKAKVHPGKNIVTGPAWLVVEDVPLPVALPFAFFPFSSSYSSGILMPTYGDEMQRGFSLRDGGYYFAFNDYVDLALTGELFTKGSWGLNARSSYRKRYKYSGNFNAGYLVTITGDKVAGDYNKATDIKLNWSHSQDAKANPFSTFSASVNFSTTSYNKNNLSNSYTPLAYENTKSSSISYSYRPASGPFSFSSNFSINQNSRDTTLSVTLPNLNITMRDIYPLRRKEQVGALRWYENIRMSYNGLLANSIQNVKEYDFFQQSLIRDWKNGMKHTIPVSASLTLFKNITITPSLNYEEKWYTKKITQKFDPVQQKIVPKDTTFGFKRIYNFSGTVSAQTKMYGMYKPLPFLGKWTQKSVIRHVMTPSVSFNGSPDFSNEWFGFYENFTYTDSLGNENRFTYSPWAKNIWNVPDSGKTGAMNFSLDNNVEMKLPIAGTDSTKKVSLIDQLRFSMGYNFLADSLKWSNISAGLRLKFPMNYTLSLNGMFDTYLYGEDGRHIDKLRWANGKFPRLISTGTSFSYSLNNSVIQKWFSKKEKSGDGNTDTSTSDGDVDNDDAIAADGNADQKPRASLRSKKEDTSGEYDADGYWIDNVPWNLNFSYSWSLGYGEFIKEKREFNYRTSKTLGISGSITPTKAWSFNFNTSYDFDRKQFATMQCSITRQMHCWSMSASLIPIGPYQSYNFSIAVNSAMLSDLKYNQSSNYRDARNWGE